AVKAVAIGDGVGASRRLGSEVHDAIYFDDARRYHRTSNRAGGLEGGVTNGQDVVVRAYMKPISTLRKGLPSVDIDIPKAILGYLRDEGVQIKVYHPLTLRH